MFVADRFVSKSGSELKFRQHSAIVINAAFNQMTKFAYNASDGTFSDSFTHHSELIVEMHRFVFLTCNFCHLIQPENSVYSVVLLLDPSVD